MREPGNEVANLNTRKLLYIRRYYTQLPVCCIDYVGRGIFNGITRMYSTLLSRLQGLDFPLPVSISLTDNSFVLNV